MKKKHADRGDEPEKPDKTDNSPNGSKFPHHGERCHCDTPRFVSQKQLVALFPFFTESWLERDRWARPSVLPFYRLGRKIVYDVQEVASILAATRVG